MPKPTLTSPARPKARTPVIGRFAPSPTGALHLGSLLTAVASYCAAKQVGGQWLVRIEDLDTDRCHNEYSAQILRDLTRLGLHWDGEVRYQSAHTQTYHALLDGRLRSISYGCDCSRKSIREFQHAHHLPETRYPRCCLHAGRSRQHAVRLILPNYTMVFYDHLQGVIVGNPQREHGDIVVRRRAPHAKCLGMMNYMLAVVVDDALQGVNQIVRGLDILPLTLAQLAIADYLDLPLVRDYYHLPLVVNADGQKLSKQTLAEPISHYPADQLLILALKLLQQAPVARDKPEHMLAQAVAQWDSRPLAGKQALTCPPLADLIQTLFHL